MVLHFLLVIFLPLIYNAVCSGPPVIETKYGKVEGFEYQVPNGTAVNVFLGIKYATNERFEKPVQVNGWDDVLKAKEFGKRCHNWISAYENMTGWITPDVVDEDCLNLNIIAPKDVKEKAPVLFFINCGGFEFGDGPMFGYKRLAEQIVSQGIVVVTFNYRLGIYGWLSLDEKYLPGNLGLWDIKTALEFTRQVIPDFGGNASRITVGGESAGGALTSILVHSPLTRDLFAQALPMSGSITANWAVQGERSVKTTRAIADYLKCDGDTEFVKNCLKSKTPRQLDQAIMKTGPTGTPAEMFVFSPRLDDVFLKRNYADNFDDVPEKPVFLTLQANESNLLCGFPGLPLFSGCYQPEAVLNNWTRTDFVEFIRESFVKGLGLENSCEAIADLYLKRHKQDVTLAYMELYSDYSIHIPARQSIDIKRTSGWENIYLLVLNAPMPPGNVEGNLKGAWHASELPLFTDLPHFGADLNKEQKKLQRIFVPFLVNFIKYGNPSNEYSFQLIVPKGNYVPYVSISPDYDNPISFQGETYQFWLKLYLENPKSKLSKIFPAVEVVVDRLCKYPETMGDLDGLHKFCANNSKRTEL